MLCVLLQLMKHEIHVKKCEWKHQKLDDLMNYKFLLYPIVICISISSIAFYTQRRRIIKKKMRTRNKVEQNMDLCGVMSCIRV